MISEAIDKVGKDGVITVEESQTFGMEMDLVEGMRFDKGYISPYFVTDPERMEADPRRRLRAARLLEDLLGPRPRAGAREGHAGRSPARHHRRGRRGRGPRHARRQQDPRHVQVGRRQGPRLRRAPQGDAPGHGHPHRRPGDLRRGRPQARERHPRPARLGQAGDHHQGRDDRRRGCRHRGRHQGPDQPDQGRDREHRLGLRPGEASGAPRQAVRRCRRAQGRRRHRGGAEGEEAPHRGRRVDHQGGHRRGRRARRWRGPAACPDRRAGGDQRARG